MILVRIHASNHQTVNCFRAHASANRRCLVFLDRKAIQELRVKDSLSFFECPEEFLGNKPEIRTQSYASAL
jgi:hypothetical protein